MQSSALSLDFEPGSQVILDMQANSRLFIERRQQLQTIRLDTDVFNDTRFQSLRSFEEPIQEQPVGRANLFEAPGG